MQGAGRDFPAPFFLSLTVSSLRSTGLWVVRYMQTLVQPGRRQ